MILLCTSTWQQKTWQFNPVHLTNELVHRNEFHILVHAKTCYVSACFFFQNADRILGKSALLSNGKGSNVDKVQDSDTSLLVSNKADKTTKEDYLEDSEQPRSLVLVQCSSYWTLPLAQAIQTHCLNQFGFLSLNYKLKDIDQLCYDKKRKDCGSPWSIQMHTFWCNSKRWRILEPNRTKLISLLSLLPAWWIPRIMFLELF